MNLTDQITNKLKSLRTKDRYSNFFCKTPQDKLDDLIQEVILNPEQFVRHEVLKHIALLVRPELAPADPELRCNQFKGEGVVIGSEMIDPAAIDQFNRALTVGPVVGGSLMPDGHVVTGGLVCVGSTVVYRNAVNPKAVGADIGCSMCLSILNYNVDLDGELTVWDMKNALQKSAYFNYTANPDLNEFRREAPGLQRTIKYNDDPFVRNLYRLAQKQFSTSGDGNHFVNIGKMEITGIMAYNIPELLPFVGQTRLAILSHFGSRGFGAKIAKHFSERAAKQNPLPKRFKDTDSYLDFDSVDGQAYWKAMNLAVQYAHEGHKALHKRIATELDVRIEYQKWNPHNVAQVYPGSTPDNPWIAHRKGATEMREGQLGMIPGTMTSPSYFVMGSGRADTCYSSSHGAGRTHSRSAAKKAFTKADMDKALADAGVELIGAGLDEHTDAYKDIHEVIRYQEEAGMITSLSLFIPMVVRMADEVEPFWKQNKKKSKNEPHA